MMQQGGMFTAVCCSTMLLLLLPLLLLSPVAAHANNTLEDEPADKCLEDDLTAEESQSEPIFITIIQGNKEPDYYIDTHPVIPLVTNYKQPVKYYPPPPPKYYPVHSYHPPTPHHRQDSVSHDYEVDNKYHHASDYDKPSYNKTEYYHEPEYHPPRPLQLPHSKHKEGYHYNVPLYHRNAHPEPNYYRDYQPPSPPHKTYHQPDYQPPSPQKTYHQPDYQPPSPHKTYHQPDYQPPSPHKTYHQPDYQPPSSHTTYHQPDYQPPSPHKTYHQPDYQPPSPQKTYHQPDYQPLPQKTDHQPDYQLPSPPQKNYLPPDYQLPSLTPKTYHQPDNYHEPEYYPSGVVHYQHQSPIKYELHLDIYDGKHNYEPQHDYQHIPHSYTENTEPVEAIEHEYGHDSIPSEQSVTHFPAVHVVSDPYDDNLPHRVIEATHEPPVVYHPENCHSYHHLA
nr:uncharacterized protein LOC128701250 [Cherax quadricarinatus]